MMYFARFTWRHDGTILDRRWVGVIAPNPTAALLAVKYTRLPVRHVLPPNTDLKIKIVSEKKMLEQNPSRAFLLVGCDEGSNYEDNPREAVLAETLNLVRERLDNPNHWLILGEGEAKHRYVLIDSVREILDASGLGSDYLALDDTTHSSAERTQIILRALRAGSADDGVYRPTSVTEIDQILGGPPPAPPT